jgi:hypothetical protein
MNCTWKDCNEKAEHPQLDKNNNEWANLCEAHNEKLEKALGSPDEIKTLLGCWVKASGGANKIVYGEKDGSKD